MTIRLHINGQTHVLALEANMPLLWVLRDVLGLTGTKFGCGLGQCGACTVHVDGVAMRSCVLPVEAVKNKIIQTIEGTPSAVLAMLQKTWVAHQVPQCGYCQSGLLMAAAAFLEQQPQPSPEDIAQALTNICRCGTYQRVEQAILDAAEQLAAK
ncbi:MAG TPA: (2Fe-2S)-binding protein [Burkholderiaceae bacterium]|nr:(2Fe-2S)-binding protein [Burkholderiaceae bacterium]